MNRKQQPARRTAQPEHAWVGQGKGRLVFVCRNPPRNTPRQDVTATIPHHLFARGKRESSHMAGVSPVRIWNVENGGCRFYSVAGALAAPCLLLPLPPHRVLRHGRSHARLACPRLKSFLLRSANDRRPS